MIEVHLPEHVVLELVVAGEGDHAAPGDAQREEDLDTGIRPHLQLTGQVWAGNVGNLPSSVEKIFH